MKKDAALRRNLRDPGRRTWWVFIFDDDIDPKTNQHPSRLVFNALQLIYRRKVKKAQLRRWNEQKNLIHSVMSVEGPLSNYVCINKKNCCVVYIDVENGGCLWSSQK